MTGALLLTAALMGLAGTPHCAAMCAAGCAAAARRCTPGDVARGSVAVLVGRLLAYALAGAAAASVVGGLRWLAEVAGWLRPLWHGLQFFMVLIGAWLLLRGRMPAAIEAWVEGRGAPPPSVPSGARRVALPGELKAAGLGLLWPALPCGLLHAALLLAAVASSPAEGAAVMAVFALVSSAALVLGPVLWLRLVPAALRRADAGAGDLRATWPLRLSGLMVLLMSAWSLAGHGPWVETLIAWCS
ncbi:MAG: hypothetical protein RLZZ592_401 [Pseudomonadota bacterium]|jgi:sulfite exporter TauE/SafE|nr:uncharacterized protein [Pseudomonadota bacterium]